MDEITLATLQETLEPHEIERVKTVEMVEDVATPVMLEDSPHREDLLSAIDIVKNQLLLKIIKGTCSVDEIARYNALK